MKDARFEYTELNPIVPIVPDVGLSRITKAEVAFAVWAYHNDLYDKIVAGSGTVDLQKVGRWFYYADIPNGDYKGTYKQYDLNGVTPADLLFTERALNNTSGIVLHVSGQMLSDSVGFTNNWAEVNDDRLVKFYINDNTMPSRLLLWHKITYLIEGVTTTYITPPHEIVINGAQPFVFPVPNSTPIVIGGAARTFDTNHSASGQTLQSITANVCLWGGDLQDGQDYLNNYGGVNYKPVRGYNFGVQYADSNGTQQSFGWFASGITAIRETGIQIANSLTIPTSPDNIRNYLPIVWTRFTYALRNANYALRPPYANTSIYPALILYEYTRWPYIAGMPLIDTDNPISYTIGDFASYVSRQAVMLMEGETSIDLPLSVSVPTGEQLKNIDIKVTIPQTAVIYSQSGLGGATPNTSWTSSQTTNAAAEEIGAATPPDITDTGDHTLYVPIDIPKIYDISGGLDNKPVVIRALVKLTADNQAGSPLTLLNDVPVTLYCGLRNGSFNIVDYQSSITGILLRSMSFTLSLPYPTAIYKFLAGELNENNGFNNGRITGDYGSIFSNTDVNYASERSLNLRYSLGNPVNIDDGEFKVKLISDFGSASTSIVVATLETNDESNIGYNFKSMLNTDNTTSVVLNMLVTSPVEPNP